jgi:hypothetical protein
MAVIVGLDLMGKGETMQNISSDQRDEKRVLHVVIKCIASSEAFDGTASQRPEPVGCFFVRRTEHLTEVLRQKLAQTLCCRCCNRLQTYSPRYPENLAYPRPSARTARSAPAALSKVARCSARLPPNRKRFVLSIKEVPILAVRPTKLPILGNFFLDN